MNKITLTTFTDPMMGLSYECEPIFRKLETHFAGQIEFKYSMGLLVRNVYELCDCNELAQSPALGLHHYNARLAKIYESEESISGMPINMDGFCLFSTEETSSLPLNLAYKAVSNGEWSIVIGKRRLIVLHHDVVSNANDLMLNFLFETKRNRDRKNHDCNAQCHTSRCNKDSRTRSPSSTVFPIVKSVSNEPREHVKG